MPRENDVAVVIGVEKYRQGRGGSLPDSTFSSRDAKLMQSYLLSLGFAPKNIDLLTDDYATRSDMVSSLEGWLPDHVKQNGSSKVFIYYSGHGAPDPKTGETYLVPHDANLTYMADSCYPVKRLYTSLAKLPASEVVVLLDSCFSGTTGPRSVGVSNVRALVPVLEITPGSLPARMAVLAASQADQNSASSSDKGHGLFTYYFLKAIKDGKKELGDIYQYVKPKVEDDARLQHVDQSPKLISALPDLKGKFIISPSGEIRAAPVRDPAAEQRLKAERQRIEEQQKELAEEKRRLAEREEEMRKKLAEAESLKQANQGRLLEEQHQLKREREKVEEQYREVQARKKAIKKQSEPVFMAPTF